uniref:GH10432p n=1 Tax=Drosophila melanogaster TaxID=7227 RepID=Q8MSJ1_DROME|nr:GH10432p [Drosophila melanogaster]
MNTRNTQKVRDSSPELQFLRVASSRHRRRGYPKWRKWCEWCNL